MGSVTIRKVLNEWNVSSINCCLTNCIMGNENSSQVLVVHQLAYVIVTTAITGP